MIPFLQDHLVAVLTVLTLLSRLADIGTTYLATPTLMLEANILVRRFRWKYAWLTVLAGFVPYWSIPGGIVIMSVSFFVASSNATKIMMVRALGETEYVRLASHVTRATPPFLGWLYLMLPAVLFAIPGLTMFVFDSDPTHGSFWFAEAIVTYAGIVAFWGSVRYFQRRKEALP